MNIVLMTANVRSTKLKVMCQFSLRFFAISNVVVNEADVQAGVTFRTVQGFKFDIFRGLFFGVKIIHKMRCQAYQQGHHLRLAGITRAVRLALRRKVQERSKAANHGRGLSTSRMAHLLIGTLLLEVCVPVGY